MMNAEIKARWVDALRSGAYMQGAGALRSGSAFCCLGVLCDLHSKETGNGWIDGMYSGERGYLPRVVREWAELSDYNPFIGEDSLGGYNDRGLSFDKIADLIEKRL